MKAPSHVHANMPWQNWLVYRITDSWLLNHAGRLKGGAFDLGAGEAPCRPWLLQHDERCVAVDRPVSMHAARSGVAADPNRPLPVAGAVADAVIASSLLEPPCEPESMLREACRILRPGGCLVLQVPWPWAVHEAPHDHFPDASYGLRHLSGRAGFARIEMEPQSGFITMWLLTLGTFRLRLVRALRWMRLLLRSALLPRWIVSQLCASVLGQGRDRAAGSAGCFVIARIP